MSFAKRAPELAEEILLKAASPLPESLRTFSRDLIEKQANIERERLQLPPRMTLSDLQKMTSDKQVDLPKIAEVSCDEYSNVADSLRKIAARGEQDMAQDIFLTAAAMVADRQEKDAAIRRTIVGAAAKTPPKPTFFERARSPFLSHSSPTKQKVRAFAAHGEKGIAAIESATPGTDAYRDVTARGHAKAMEGLEAEQGKRTSKSIHEAVKGIPTAAGAIGVGAAATAIAGKKDEKKIVAERAFSS